MRSIFRSVVCGAAFLALGPSAAMAAAYASLQVVEGPIMVNHGAGFEPAIGAVDLNAGDRIMAGENASGVLHYPTCTVVVMASSIVTVSKSAPCVAGQISNVAVDEDAIFGPFIPAYVIPGEMAVGFVALVGIEKYLISAPASN
jgi:hypothetical protein